MGGRVCPGAPPVPPSGRPDGAAAAAMPTGEVELAALEQAPATGTGQSRWRRCCWRGLTPTLGSGRRWRAGGSRPRRSAVRGERHEHDQRRDPDGPVLQGRDFTGLTFGAAPPVPPGTGDQDT